MATARRRPPARRGPTSVAWLGILAVVILGGGATLAMLKKQQGQAQTAPPGDAGKSRPFADMPPETPPARSSGGGESAQPFGSPAALLSDPVWQRAVELAEQGEALYQQAVEAKTKGDVPTLNARGNEAKRKLDEALETTAQLEEDLIAERGETDSLVRNVQRVRNRWFDRVRWLHKSTSR
jgi:hypothetical protein